MKIMFEPLEEQFKDGLWATFTFFKSTCAKTAERRLRKFLKYINSTEKYFYRKYLRGWFFFERDPERNGVHVHALIQGISKKLTDDFEKECCEHLGSTKILNMHDGVANYLNKKYFYLNTLEDYKPFMVNSALRK